VPETGEQEKPALIVELRDGGGGHVGTADLSEGSTGVQITVNLRKGQRVISPGEHGLHIHEKGDITPSFEAAGSHFNPTNARHGFENPQGPHAGDLGNIAVLADGSASYSTASDRLTLSGGENSLLDEDGSAIIITQRPDDYTTDPDGNSGAGVAGGVIEKPGVLSTLGSGLLAAVLLLSVMGLVPWGLVVGRGLSRR
jgi:Cu-Zn family superoxide dismutase